MASNNTAMYKIGYYVGQTLKLNLGKKKPVTIQVDLDNGSKTADGISHPTSDVYQAFSTSEQYYISTIEFISQNTTSVTLNSKLLLSDIIHLEVNSSAAITWQIQERNNLLTGGFIIYNAHVSFNNQIFNVEHVNQQAGVDFCYPFVVRYSTVVFNNCKFSSNSMVLMLLSGSNVILNSCTIDGNNNIVAQCFEAPSLITSINSSLGDSNKLKDDTSLWIQTTQ